MTVLAVYRDPFSFAPTVRRFSGSVTLGEMASMMPGLPADFGERGFICLNGEPVDRGLWHLVRPKREVTEVTFHATPMGGGDSGKNILATIASIGLTVVSGGIALGGWAQMGSWFVAKSVSAYALAAGVSLVGSLLLSSLVAPPTPGDDSFDRRGDASASGNTLSPNSPIPRVVGQRKVYPPLAMEPLVYFDGPDEVVEAAYVLAGPHQISEVKIGASNTEDMVGVEVETREGWVGEPLVSMVRRQARTEATQSELRGHEVSDDDNRTLESSTGDRGSALPYPQIVATRQSPDEHQLQVVFSQGLGNTANEDVRLRVPVRVRVRPVGGEWVRFPELHFRAGRIGQIRATIRLVWTDDPLATLSASTGDGWAETRTHSPGQSVSPVSEDWDADSYFYAGSGDNYMDSNNLGSTGVRHVQLDRYSADFLLDPAVFPRGRYEIEIVRGCSFNNSSYSPADYEYSGSVWDFFGARGEPGQIAMSRENVVDAMYLLRSVSIWNEHPVPSRDVAVVAVRARNRSLDSVSCVAAGWVRDWDGTGWSNWVVTDNPAPHFRDILVGAENIDPVPVGLIEDSWLVSWRSHCTSMGYKCNALIEDQTVHDAARIVAACGYARPYMSDVWAVVYDRDRSEEEPMQLFTQNNMYGFQWTKGFSRVPDALLVNYRDKFADYNTMQIQVPRPGLVGDGVRVEQVTYEGLVTEDEARMRAEYDQMQAMYRSTFYSWECDSESVLCRQGDLVAVQHDMISSWSGSGRVIDIMYDGSGDVVGLVIDNMIPFSDEPDMLSSPDLLGVDDLLMSGVPVGVSIMRGDSVSTHVVSGVSGNVVSFSPAIPADDIEIGSMVASGPVGSEHLRLVVSEIAPTSQFRATITAVDEAAIIWNSP